MAGNRLLIEGIEDFRNLPRQLRDAAAPIVEAGARRAADRVRDAYPRGPTGNLKAGVKVVQRSGADPSLVQHYVLSNAPHAHLYEFGTVRQRARPTFRPITTAEISATIVEVVALVQAAGFTVTGANG